MHCASINLCSRLQLEGRVATSEAGRFGGGKATASLNAFACVLFLSCADVTVERTVSLRRGGG
jgi:hypothetical protein